MMKRLIALLITVGLASCSTQHPPANPSITATPPTHQAIKPHAGNASSPAILEMEKKAAEQPNNPELLFNLAMTYLHEDDVGKTTRNQPIALATLNKVLTLAPGNVATLKAIYNIHYDNTVNGEKNALKEARRIFQQIPPAQRDNLNPPSLAKFVHLYIVNKNSQGQHNADVYNALLKASIEQPNNDKSYLQLARMYREKNYYPLALATLKLGEENIKDSPELYRAIATTYEERAETSGCSYEKTPHLNAAIEYYKRAIPLAADDVRLHYSLAQLYMDHNLYQLALHETAITTELDPSAENLAFAAQNYSIIGNQQKANELLDRANRAGLARSDSAFHEIYMNSGQWNKAALSFTEYLHAQKNISVYDFMKADIIGQQADIEFSSLTKNKKIHFNSEWEAAVYAFWTHKISSNQLKKNAINSCQRTEYFFYSGYRDYQAGNKDVAKQQFSSVMQQKTYRFIERPLARYFLTLN